MKYIDFCELCKKKSYSNVIYYNESIVNFFYHNRDQKKTLQVDCDGVITDVDLIDSFTGFNVVFTKGFSKVDNFMVFIDPSKNVIDDMRNAISMNLPDGKLPTHVCILSEDISEVNRCFNELIAVYPNLVLVQNSEEFNSSKAIYNSAVALLGGRPVFDIFSYCDLLSKFFSENSKVFLEKFDEAVVDILDKHESRYIVYSGDYQSRSFAICKLLVCEIYNRDPRAKFFFHKNDSLSISEVIKSSLWCPDRMLVEDVISFLKGLPRLVCEKRPVGIVYHLVSDNKSVGISAHCVPVNDLSKARVETIYVDANKCSIRPFKDYFDMESGSLKECVEKETECREFIHSLYSVFSVKGTEVLNLTNVFFFVKDGIEYVGYCLEYKFSVPVKSMMEGLKVHGGRLTFNDIKRLTYLDVFADTPQILKYYQSSTKMIFNTKSVTPIRTARKNFIVYSRYKFFNSCTDWEDVPGSVFALGMYSDMSYVSRNGFKDSLMQSLGVEKVRKLLDSFGGFNLVTNSRISLSMKR